MQQSRNKSSLHENDNVQFLFKLFVEMGVLEDAVCDAGELYWHMFLSCSIFNVIMVIMVWMSSVMLMILCHMSKWRRMIFLVSSGLRLVYMLWKSGCLKKINNK